MKNLTLVKIKDTDGCILFAIRNNKGDFITEFRENLKKVLNIHRKIYHDTQIFDTDTVLFEIEFETIEDLLTLIPEEFL